jgi:IS30 family transposase
MTNTLKRIPGSHLTYEERCQISALLARETSGRDIAKTLGVHRKTIYSELFRNKTDKHYYYKNAQKMSDLRRRAASSKPQKMTSENISLITKMLTETQSSPQQISGRLRKNGAVNISHESIYRFIWADKRAGGELYFHLRHKAKKYNKRSGKTAGRGCIPNRVDIDQRPEIVEKKERFGDFELDTIVGANHQGAIVSIVDRASKYTFLRLLKRGTAEAVKSSIGKALKGLSASGFVLTLTSDNGKEFSAHEKISSLTGADFFFAKPYHSWERGLNEHTNGLVRQYFPKGTDFTILTEAEVLEVEQKLNDRPRAILYFDTPKERLLALCANFSPGALHC